MTQPLLSFTDHGIYCAQGDFFIDPWRPVARALITHGHSDHARWGHGSYLATHQALPVMRHRLGDIRAEGVLYGERREINGVAISFHPAGHVPGSAQIRVAYKGEIWVVSGDYKLEEDGLSERFEPVPCHAFVSECTFGLPLFRWQRQAVIADQIRAWWQANAAAGKQSVIAAYGLGKAQRLICLLGRDGPPILTHTAVENTTRILRSQGYAIPETEKVTPDMSAKTHPGRLVIAPPSALGSAWAKRLGPSAEAFASGWMALRGIRRRRGLAQGFVISDHADWPDLNRAIAATGASRIFVTHGYTAPFRRWLAEQGYEAGIVETGYGGDQAEEDGDDSLIGPAS